MRRAIPLKFCGTARKNTFAKTREPAEEREKVESENHTDRPMVKCDRGQHQGRLKTFDRESADNYTRNL